MYPSDLTDVQWLQLEPLLQRERGERHGGGRPRKYELRRIVDAMLYVVKTGCQWRQMPVDFPPWVSVYQQFRTWRDGGIWERIGTTCANGGAKRRVETPRPAWPLSIRSLSRL